MAQISASAQNMKTGRLSSPYDECVEIDNKKSNGLSMLMDFAEMR